MAENEVNKKIRKDGAMVTNNLTEDIIFDLLSCLPVKSLLRFRCVCKSWCALITNPHFVKMHLNQSIATNNQSIISIKECKKTMEEYVIKVFSVNLDDCERRGKAAFVVKFDYPFPIPTGHYFLTSCNGLVYMCDDIGLALSKDCDLPAFLFNPSTRQHKKLPYTRTDFPSNSHGAFLNAYGFGYDPTTDDYNVIRVLEFSDDKSYSNYIGFEVKVYSLSSNSWRRLDIPLFKTQQTVGVFINSAFHWVLDRTTASAPNVIVSVDIKDDELREVPLPDLVEDKFYMTLGVLGEKLQLCMLCDFPGVGVEFWVMKDYGVRESWEKRLLIEKPVMSRYFENYFRPICYSKKGGVVLKTGRALVLYDPQKRKSSNLKFCSPWHTVCIESLVSFDTKDGADKKKE